MRGKGLLWIAFMAAGLSAYPALGQEQPASKPPEAEPNQLPPVSEMGGSSARDLIRLDGKTFSIPLRNAGVLRGTEEVEIDGRKLERGKDYSIDYPTGTIMLMVPVREGSSLRVSYRHDKTLARSSSTAGSALNAMKLTFAPGATATFGLGLIEREAGGRVSQMDLYAFRNNFSGGGNLGLGMRGVFALSNRKQVQSSSLMGGNNSSGDQALGQGTAIVQDLSGKVAGGSVSVSYQDVTKNFSGFFALSENGFDEAAIQALAKERGFKRLGYAMRDLNVGGLKFSNALDTVADGNKAITNRSLAVARDGFRIANSSRKVDQGFNRFNDLRNQDREALKLETGLTTDEWFAEFARNRLNLNIQTKAVTNGSGQGFHRQSWAAKVDKVEFNYGTQRIDNGFNRLQATREQGWQQLAREQGLSREMFGLKLGPVTRQLSALDLQSSQVRSKEGRFHALDLNAQGAGWSMQHFTRSFDQGFTRLGSLSGGELNQHVSTVTRMYEPQGLQVRNEDIGAFANSRGLDRSSTRLQFQPGPGIGIQLNHLSLNGLKDSGSVTSAVLRGHKTEAGLRLANLGQDLNEIGGLMSFERERLGTLKGLRKNDYWFNTETKGLKVSADFMRADHSGAQAERDSFSLEGRGISFKFNRRSVGEQFDQVGQLVDPERELLHQIRGQEQRQIQLDWVMSRNLTAKLNWTSGHVLGDDTRMINNHTLLNWQPDALTRLEYYTHQETWREPSQALVNNRVERSMFARSLPNFGSLRIEHEKRQFFGENAPADSVRNTVMVEGALNDRTKVRAEATATKFDNGDREDVRAHTVETTVIRQAGIAVTDTTIDRNNSRPDERKRNYGFWIDFGKGLRLNYGYQSDINEFANGTRQSQVGLTSGTFGNLTFGGANYQSNQWDRSRQRSLGNFSLQTNKPVQLGFLRDASFRISSDTIRDYDVWQREQNTASLAGKAFGANLAFDYVSQYSAHHKGRAIDRIFRYQSGNDQSLLRLNANVKNRTMPDGREYTIRDVNLGMKLGNEATLAHSIKTYPEVQRGDVLLGSVLQPTRMVEWRIDQQARGQNTLFGLSWREDLNEHTKEMRRMGSVHMTLFAKNPSPLKLSYGIEQGDRQGRRATAHRYELQFDQRPGPNQNLSLYLGNVSWQHMRDQGLRAENWTMRLEWQVRF